MIAPASQAKEIKRAGLQALQARDVADVGHVALGGDVHHLPADHAVAAGGVREARDEIAAHVRIGMGVVVLASSAKAWVNSASPARMAVASSNFLWVAGLPRRMSSLSIAGRSSWASE